MKCFKSLGESNIFYNHNGMRLKIKNNKKTPCKIHKQLESEQHATKQPMCHQINQRIPLNKREWKHKNPKSIRCSKSSFQRKFYSNTSLYQETNKQKISNK